jgi:hypothetical protein
MSTEDEREKRGEGSPEWHRARANSLREMGRSRERLSSGGNGSGRNSAILKQQTAHLERIIAPGKMPMGLQGEKRPPATLAQRPALN